jgi:FkbM family methyltransferase
MKSFIKSILHGFARICLGAMVMSRVGQYFFDQLTANAMRRTQEVEHQGTRLRFSTTNTLTKYRADTFSSKEPETLDWIDRIPTGSTIWDVGANIGLYTCYAVKARQCRVFAFEPSVFNLELLARNIFYNDITNDVTIIPLPLSQKLACSKLSMTSTDWGGALSTFGQSHGHDGDIIKKVFEFPTLGLSAVDALNLLKIPVPDFIKIDVDGIEHLILEGAESLLPQVKGVLIEINDNFDEQSSKSSQYLKKAGFELTEKKHADFYDEEETAAKYTFNQIWINRSLK